MPYDFKTIEQYSKDNESLLMVYKEILKVKDKYFDQFQINLIKFKVEFEYKSFLLFCLKLFEA